jgi:hypothetical protein
MCDVGFVSVSVSGRQPACCGSQAPALCPENWPPAQSRADAQPATERAGDEGPSPSHVAAAQTASGATPCLLHLDSLEGAGVSRMWAT